MIQSLAALLDMRGARAASDTAFQMAMELFEANPDLLARAVVEVTDEGMLDDADLLCVSLALAGRVRPTSAISGASWSRLHHDAPILAATLDADVADDAVAGRWKESLGWDGRTGWPEQGAPVDRVWLDKSVDELRQIRQFLDRTDNQPLAWGGLLDAMFQWLQARQAAGDGEIIRWSSSHGHLADGRARNLSAAHAHFLEALEPTDPVSSVIRRFPRDVLAAAIHLVSIPHSYRDALAALLEAATFAPALVVRSVVLALVLERGLPSPE
jgi:hypothetical protein